MIYAQNTTHCVLIEREMQTLVFGQTFEQISVHMNINVLKSALFNT